VKFFGVAITKLVLLLFFCLKFLADYCAAAIRKNEFLNAFVGNCKAHTIFTAT